MQKRILFLGGSFFQLAPIRYAKQKGHYIITCDYLPGNPGHKFANEYHNVSTTNLQGVLQLAQHLSIDGIVAYGSDPAAATAAYVAGKLNLPGNPFESVRILTRKDLYRDFLKNNDFHVPHSASFSSVSEAQDYFKSVNTPVMVKPVDSSGSKGVSKVVSSEQMPLAFREALSFSQVKVVIVEEYIERKGYQIAGDGFVWKGKLAFRCFAQEHFMQAGNMFVPVGESFPLQATEDLQAKVHEEINRLMELLHMKTGALNFDIMLNQQDDVYLMEVGPRSGGNVISEVINYSTGVNLAGYVVDAALGQDCEELVMYKEAACYSSYMLHSKEKGLFKAVDIEPFIEQNIVEKSLFIREGDPVEAFTNSGGTLGYLILKFDSAKEMLTTMESMAERVHLKVISYSL